jgi:hypothetical protein
MERGVSLREETKREKEETGCSDAHLGSVSREELDSVWDDEGRHLGGDGGNIAQREVNLHSAGRKRASKR